jgi:hypothetical protein
MKNQVKKATNAEQELRAKLVALVDGLPEGPEQIQRLSKNVCVVSTSTIAANGGILCPNYYMSGTSKDRLKRIFQDTSLKSLDDKIKEILETGWIPESNKNRIKVCPEFQAALEKLWYGTEQEVA